MKQLLGKILLLAVTLSSLGLLNFKRQAGNELPIPMAIQQAFQTWKVAHRKIYKTPAEEIYRLSVYFANYLKIKAHTNTSYKFGLNLFAGLTYKEFLSKYTRLRLKNKNQSQASDSQFLQ